MFKLKDGYSLPLFADGTAILHILKDDKIWLCIRTCDPRSGRVYDDKSEQYAEDRQKAEQIVVLLNVGTPIPLPPEEAES